MMDECRIVKNLRSVGGGVYKLLFMRLADMGR